MTLKTFIAAAAVALAFAPSANAAGMTENASARNAQQARWSAYDTAVRTAYAEPSAAPVRRAVPTIPQRDVPTGTRVVLAFFALSIGASIIAIRRRDTMFRPAAGGWDM